jgi:hypothetical protein
MKTIKAEEIPAEAGARDFLQSLDLSHGEVVLEQNGKPRMVLMSAQLLEQRQRAKEELFALICRLHRQHAGLDSEVVLGELEEIDHPERAAP